MRIVVRRVLPGETGPSGGPAMTDVLGTCLSWGDGVCVVQPDAGADGSPVRIPIADIVSGKPVPPRTSPRLRVEPQEAQVRALALWPDLEPRPLGSLAAAPVRDLDRTAGQLGAGDDAVGRRGRLRVGGRVLRGPGPAADRGGPPGLGGGRDVPLARLGAREPRRGHRLRGRGRRPGQSVPSGTSPSGVDVLLEGDDHLVTAEARTDDGRVLASGVAAYDDDWVGFRTIEVDPAERGRGLGLLIMAELLEWGAERGATTAYLQVLGDNARAFRLYDGLGFVPHHRYRYLAAPL